jgi:hypothetical protein
MARFLLRTAVSCREAARARMPPSWSRPGARGPTQRATPDALCGASLVFGDVAGRPAFLPQDRAETPKRGVHPDRDDPVRTAGVQAGWLVALALRARRGQAPGSGRSVGGGQHHLAALRWLVAGVAPSRIRAAAGDHDHRVAARGGQREARPRGVVAVRREIVRSADASAALAAYRAQQAEPQGPARARAADPAAGRASKGCPGAARAGAGRAARELLVAVTVVSPNPVMLLVLLFGGLETWRC